MSMVSKRMTFNRALYGIFVAIGTWVLFTGIHHSAVIDRYGFIASFLEEQAVASSSTLLSPRRSSTSERRPKTTIPLGQRIIRRSFRETWADLLTLCPKNETVHPRRVREDYLKRCLERAHREGGKLGSPSNRKWPWWLRTLWRDMTDGKSGVVGRWHILQFDDPRLQLCVYEKGGTKQWKRLHCRHNHLVVQKRSDEPIPDFNQCWVRQPAYDNVTEGGSGGGGGSGGAAIDPGSKSAKVVFLRDPLDRFLSGFLDKCVRRLDVVDHCEPTSLFNASTSPVSNMLWDKQMFFKMYVDTMPLKWNLHFFPQALQCGGLYKDVDEYDFVGSMGHNFYRDLGRLADRYPSLEESIESIFSLSKRANITNEKGVETQAAEQVLEYYTPDTVRRVLEIYAVDYILLNLSIPDWAEEMLSTQAGTTG